MPSLAEIVLEGGRLRSDALRRNAEIVANQQRNSGLLWGQLASNLGQTALQGVQQFQEGQRYRAEQPMRDAQLQEQQQRLEMGRRQLADSDASQGAAQQRARLNQIALNSWEQDDGGSYRLNLDKVKSEADQAGIPFDPSALKPHLDAMNAFNTQAHEAQTGYMNRAIDVVHATGDSLDGFTQMVHGAQLNRHLREDEATALIKQATADPSKIPSMLDQLQGKAPEKPQVVGKDAALVGPQGNELYRNTAPPEPDKGVYRVDPTKSGLTFVGNVPAGSQVLQQAQPPTTNIYNTPQGREDLKDTARQLATGNLVPSMLSKRGDYNGILAEANRISRDETGHPLNLVKLQTEYGAAQKWASSQNAPAAQRFYGLADSVVNTIDEVKALADELKQGGVQLWNKASRSTIQSVYGNTPQSDLAARYVGAVNTLKEEFANLANGGFAPTEPAWALANDQINKDFGFKDMAASLTEVQRLINFRVNSLQNVHVRSPFADQPGPAVGQGSPVTGPAPGPTPSPTALVPPTSAPPDQTGTWRWDGKAWVKQ
jgi:hypothetical protein